MNKDDLLAFAHELREILEEQGVRALMGRFDWAQRFWGLGFEMDCGRSFEQRYGLRLGDAQELSHELNRIDDVRALGNAVFSQCRYITHWSYSPENESVDWLLQALERLEELVAGPVA
ncbi:hypothetical protein [Thermophilibacter sp.]